MNIAPKYYCPQCKSNKVIDHGEYIECLECSLEFFKDYIGEIDDENILAEQELKGFIDTFGELKDKKIRRYLSRSLKNNNV
ncbi:MAG: hypothetical protein ACFE9Q_17685 [Candidatus Hodarchaeota archaeon]